MQTDMNPDPEKIGAVSQYPLHIIQDLARYFSEMIGHEAEEGTVEAEID